MNELARLGRIVRLARDPRARIEEVEQCIASSPRLAAEVVRVADSRLCGVPGRIHSLLRALLILGAEEVGAIAAAIAVRQELRGNAALWLHSLETGVCSRLVAGWLGTGLETDAFLAGLVHELGEEYVRCISPHPFPAFLRAAHAITRDVPDPSALTELDLYPDDVDELHAELAARLKDWTASL